MIRVFLMFIPFFYKLKEVGVPVSPTSFLKLHQAMAKGLVNSIDDFYVAARTILIKSERYFDLYDQVFAHVFHGIELTDSNDYYTDFLAHAMLQEWLEDPKKFAGELGIDKKNLQAMSPDELLDYFKKRLKDQEGRHDGGSKWIGTGGTSPVGHSGYHPGGMRVGGIPGNKSAVQVAAERRYVNYATDGVLTAGSIGEALKRLRNLVPEGPKDCLNIDGTITRTIRNGGEIELVFDHAVVDRLQIILAIDNGGWSMEPYVDIVQSLFGYAKAQFKDLKTYFFHNTVYDLMWEDSARHSRPVNIADFEKFDPDTRLIIVGDASMAPYELMATDGSIYAFERSGKPSLDRLRFLAETFRHSIWLNPIPARQWPYTQTITIIESIFPMFELSLDGLEKGVNRLL